MVKCMLKVQIVSHRQAECRRFVDALNGQHDFRVVAVSTNLMEAYNDIETSVPDVVIVDQSLTIIDEFQMILDLCKALKSIWVDFNFGSNERQKFHPSIDHRIEKIASLDLSLEPDAIIQQLRLSCQKPQRHEHRAEGRTTNIGSFGDKIVLIGASTGGVEALSRVLSEFPKNCPPTIIVQHTGSNFGSGLVQILNRVCPAQVCSAKNAQHVTSGMVVVAAGTDLHLHLAAASSLRVRFAEGAPISGHLPSIDALFQSAIPVAKKVVATLLTGMGRDGANGLLLLRRAGAQTFVQDEKSSIVYGMPKVAWEIGAAQERLNLTQISKRILESCESKKLVK